MIATIATTKPAQVAACLAFLLFGCSDGGGDAPAINTDCTPLYEPTFTNVFNNTLARRCGVAGGACHSQEGAQAGVVFAEIESAYALLTGASTGRPLVSPEDPDASILLSRVAATDPGRVMPPGMPLAESELCAIVLWETMGAQR